MELRRGSGLLASETLVTPLGIVPHMSGQRPRGLPKWAPLGPVWGGRAALARKVGVVASGRVSAGLVGIKGWRGPSPGLFFSHDWRMSSVKWILYTPSWARGEAPISKGQLLGPRERGDPRMLRREGGPC